MSLVLNMVGGGGSFTATDALLRVQAPANSIVTITKGTTTKTDLGHENADDHTVYDYYFIIHQSQFDSVNPWTVTGSLTGYPDASDTIIIDSSDEYNLTIVYRLYLYNYGDKCIDVTGDWSTGAWRYNSNSASGKAPTVTYNSDNVYLSLTNGAGDWYANNAIDVTNYSTINVVQSNANPSHAFSLQGYITKSTYVQNTTFLVNIVLGNTSSTPQTATGDISNITGNLYFDVWSSWNSGTATSRIYAIYLEK